MKKIFYAVFTVAVILLFCGEQVKAQAIIEDGYYSSSVLDGIKNPKATMYVINEKSKKFGHNIFSILDSPNIYDGSQIVTVVINYNIFVDENGKFVKITPVEKLPGDVTNNKKEVTFLNPKEATDFMTREVSKLDFRIGKKNGKPVKYCYNYMELLSRAPSKNKDKKQADIIVEGDEFYKSLDKTPVPVTPIKPQYPEIAKRAGIKGRVMVSVLIDEKGNASEAKVVKSLGAGLDESAVAAIKEAKFNPGILNGKPVKVRIVYPVDYQLKK
jgi:TonB family protein